MGLYRWWPQNGTAQSTNSASHLILSCKNPLCGLRALPTTEAAPSRDGNFRSTREDTVKSQILNAVSIPCRLTSSEI